MKSIVYHTTGSADVMELQERAMPEPGHGEVRVRVIRSGVNPTDWKSRAGSRPGEPVPFGYQVPNQDGSGVVDELGAGVSDLAVGDRVWLWEAAWQRAEGTAQQFLCIPSRQAIRLPDDVSFDTGASLGIPALTAHRCLTAAEVAGGKLGPGTLRGQRVLVIGGAGAVGNAAIQLARWAGAEVGAVVRDNRRAELAVAAGANWTVNATVDDLGAAVTAKAGSVDILIDVAPVQTSAHYPTLLAPDATVSIYAFGGGETFSFPVQSHFDTNTRLQFVLVYTVPASIKDQAVHDVSNAVGSGALAGGVSRGLPFHHFSLDQTQQAHQAVESGITGKVLIDVDENA
ncbi:MAG: NADPH:quinone reductase [Actinomycetales bacterium]